MMYLVLSYTTSSQAAAEYFAVVAQSGASQLQLLAAQAWNWTLDHPFLLAGGITLLVVLAWGARR